MPLFPCSMLFHSESNRALLSRIEKVEQRQSKVGYRHQMPPRLQGTERPSQILPHTAGVDDRYRHVQLPSYSITSQFASNNLNQGARLGVPEGLASSQPAVSTTTQFNIQNDVVLPRLETLRQLPSV